MMNNGTKILKKILKIVKGMTREEYREQWRRAIEDMKKNPKLVDFVWPPNDGPYV